MSIPPDAAGGTGTLNTTVYRYTPTSGQTIQGVNDGGNQIVSLEHTNTIGTLTINFPLNPSATELFEISTTGAVTALTLAAAGMSIMNAPAQLAIGDYLSFRYLKLNTWMRRI